MRRAAEERVVDSRSDIFARMRRRLGRSEGDDSAVRRVDAALAARSPGPRPPAQRDLVRAFVDKSLQMSSSIDRVADVGDVPQALRCYLEDRKLGRRAVCWPQFGGLGWSGSGIDMAVRPAEAADLVGVTGCFCAIAETGTLVLCSSPATPAATSLLPETHVAIVPAARIVAGMEEAWGLARSEFGELPRAVNFVSGPSRTGDIEQTIVIGAHGPYRVHILVVG
jgi:L-lactate dehydrogenase complex protein LldG